MNLDLETHTFQHGCCDQSSGCGQGGVIRINIMINKTTICEIYLKETAFIRINPISNVFKFNY